MRLFSLTIIVSVRRSGKRLRKEKRPLFLDDEVEELRGTDVEAVRPVSVEARGVWMALIAESRVLSLLIDILLASIYLKEIDRLIEKKEVFWIGLFISLEVDQ